MLCDHAGSAKMKQLLQDDFQSHSASVKQMLQHARRITLCIDGWSTKGLTASYFGISACFFDPLSAKPVHAFLNLSNIDHPHTGEKLADCINHSLQQWGITEDKIILVVSDNGANMLKAIRLLQAEYAETDEGQEADESSETDEDVNEDEEDQSNEELQLPHVPFRRMPCLAHTLQLIIKTAYVHYDTLIVKARKIVSRIRKSSVAMEKLIERCGKSVVTDVTTRWNSTFYMIQRLISIKTCVNDVLCEMGMVD
jgi:hypothetical protein